MSEFTTGNAPGFQAALEAQESEVLWSGRKGQDLVATKKITLVNTAADSGNTPTSTLRGGNVLAIVDTGGKANTYSPDANDGRRGATKGDAPPEARMFQTGSNRQRSIRPVPA